MHIDYFYNLFMNFLKHQSISCKAANRGTENSQISLKISLFVFQRWTRVFLWVWNNIRAGNYW